MGTAAEEGRSDPGIDMDDPASSPAGREGRDDSAQATDASAPDAMPGDLAALYQFAWLLDASIPIPGLRRRIGISPVIGLLPGIGDAIGALLAVWVLFGALRHRVPAVKILRMMVNVIVDLLVGTVPVLGDLFDFFFRENLSNVEILLCHRDRSRPPRSTWTILAAAAGVVAVVAALAIGAISAVVVLLGKLLREMLAL